MANAYSLISSSVMLLLNTRSLELCHCIGRPPLYSILCHACGSDDLGFEDFRDPETLSRKPGFRRLWQACSQARDHGAEWLWTDAVCIDRGSSAALSDALNSLSRIYQECQFSIIHLEDFGSDDCMDEGLKERLANCAWAKSVWMLPHLIFPRHSFIYDGNWDEIGTKASLAEQLSSVTSIGRAVLRDPSRLSEYSIAKRISWASTLRASRTEDKAFSLMGLLGVNMPIVYGEGDKAFVRLQEEVLRDTKDFSLFAWRPVASQGYRGLLAHSPAEFEHFQNGPNGPFRIRGEVRPVAAGIIVEACFDTVGNDLMLPLENTDGYLYSIRLSRSQYGLVRPCFAHGGQFSWLRRQSRIDSQVNSKHQGRDMGHGLVLRVCVMRDVANSGCGTLGELGPDTYPSGHEHQSPACSIGSSPWEEVGRNFATPTSSHDTDGQSLIDPDAHDWEASAPGPSESMDQSEHSKCSMTKPNVESFGPGDEQTPHGLDYETKARMPEVVCASSPSGNLDLLASGTFVEGSGYKASLDGISLAAVISTPRKLDGEHPFVHAVPILIDSLIERFRDQVRQESSTRSAMHRNSQGRKKARLSFSKSYMDLQQTLDSEDIDTVAVQHSVQRKELIACPFYLRKKQAHRTCLTRYTLKSLEDVKEHLWAVHRRPIFCPICGQTFSKTTECDIHIRSRKCRPKSPIPPSYEGVTLSHIQELARQAELHLSTEDRWFAMWKTIFPDDTENPISWVYSTEEELKICALRQLWSRYRHSIVPSVLGNHAIQADALSDRDEDVEALCNTVLNGVIEIVLGFDQCV